MSERAQQPNSKDDSEDPKSTEQSNIRGYKRLVRTDPRGYTYTTPVPISGADLEDGPTPDDPMNIAESED